MNAILTLNNLTRVFCLLIGIALASLFFAKCTPDQPKQEFTTKTVTVIKVDTVYVPRILTVTKYVDKPTLVTVYKDRVVKVKQEDGTPTLLARKYKDNVEVSKDLSVDYTANTTGTLDSIKLKVTDTRPDKVITKTITNTTTLTKNSTGLYIGAFGSKSSLGPEIQLVRPKFSVGGGYDVINQAPTVRLGINLLKDHSKQAEKSD
jgi:hypothetical protein